MDFIAFYLRIYTQISDISFMIQKKVTISKMEEKPLWKEVLYLLLLFYQFSGYSIRGDEKYFML